MSANIMVFKCIKEHAISPLKIRHLSSSLYLFGQQTEDRWYVRPWRYLGEKINSFSLSLWDHILPGTLQRTLHTHAHAYTPHTHTRDLNDRGRKIQYQETKAENRVNPTLE